MITNVLHARQPEVHDEEQGGGRRNRPFFGQLMREGNHIDDARQRTWWLYCVENRWVTLIYLFTAFALIRMWVLVSATENRVYIAITAGATAAVLIFYIRWRRRREILLREAYLQRQQENDGPLVTIQDVLVMQATMRAAQSGDTVSAENMPLVIASLPSITYHTPEAPESLEVTPPLRPHVIRSTSISSSILGTSLTGSSRIVPVNDDGFSDRVYDIAGNKVQEPLCMICLSNFQDGDILTKLPCACGHRYHRVCLISWLERKVTCPLCTVSVGGLLLGDHQNPLNRLPQSDSVIQARTCPRENGMQTNPLNSHIDLASDGDADADSDRNMPRMLGDRNIDVEDGRGQRYTDIASALPVATAVPVPVPAPAFVSAHSVTGRGRGSRYDGVPHSSI